MTPLREQLAVGLVVTSIGGILLAIHFGWVVGLAVGFLILGSRLIPPLDSERRRARRIERRSSRLGRYLDEEVAVLAGAIEKMTEARRDRD